MKILLIFCLLLITYPTVGQKAPNGVVNDRNDIVIPFVYDYILSKMGNLISINHGGKYGVIDIKGNVVVPCEYDALQFFPGVIAVIKNRYRGLLHLDGSVAVPCVYDKIEESTYSKNFLLATKGGMDGVIDSSGREIVPFIYYKAEYLSEGLIAVCKGLCGVADQSGKLKISSEYDDVGMFREGKALAKKDGKWGMINKKNEVVFPFIYDGYEPGLVTPGRPVYPVKKGEQWGLVDNVGNVLVPFRYESLHCIFDDTRLAGKKAGKFGMLDFSGKELTPMKYDMIGSSAHFGVSGYAPVIIGGKWGVINHMGKELIPAVHKPVHILSPNCFITQDELGQFGLIDSTERVLAPFQYNMIDEPNLESIINTGNSGNMINATVNGKWGCLTEKGQIAIPFVYEYISFFKDGYAVVQQGGKRGTIDLRGKVAIPIVYREISYLGDGLFTVRR